MVKTRGFRGWKAQSKRHSIVSYGAFSSTSSLQQSFQPLIQSGDLYNMIAPPSYVETMAEAEKLIVKHTIEQKETVYPIDRNTVLIVKKPPEGHGFPLSGKFIAQYIKAFIPEKDRKRIRKIILSPLIKGTTCYETKCIAEYVAPDTLYFYYPKINADGTYTNAGYTREEFIVRFLFDIIPHEFGHKVDCDNYEKKTKRLCTPSKRAERSARAYASEFRNFWRLPEAWYYETNENHDKVYTPTMFAKDIINKYKKNSISDDTPMTF